MKKQIILLLIIVLILGLFIGYKIQGDLTARSTNGLGRTVGFAENIRLVEPTFGSVTLVTTTSTPIVEVPTGGQYTRFCNEDASANAWISVGGDAAVSTGVFIPPKTCWPEDGVKVQLTGTPEGIASATSTLSYTIE